MTIKTMYKKIYYNYPNIVSKGYYLVQKNSKKVKGTGNLIEHSQSLLKRVRFEIYGNNNEVFIRKGTRLSDIEIIIRGSGHKLVIGELCRLNGKSIAFEDENCEIRIGNYTTIESAEIAVTEPGSKIVIGDDCMFSAGIDIRNGDSHSIINLETQKRINYARNIEIENHVWLGRDVRVLKGVKIKSNSVIASNSLVTKDIPENSIASGLPAKVIKEGVTWDRQRIYD